MRVLIFISQILFCSIIISGQQITPKTIIYNSTPENNLLDKIFYDIGTNKKIRKLFNDAIPEKNPNIKIIQIDISNIVFEDSLYNERRRLVKIDDEYSLFFIHFQDRSVYTIYKALKILFFRFKGYEELFCGFYYVDFDNSKLIIFKYTKDKKGNWKLEKTKIID